LTCGQHGAHHVKQLSPILEELAIEYAGRLLIAKVDADAEPSRLPSTAGAVDPLRIRRD